MPAKNPRLNLTLQPELFDLIDELASLRGVSRASVVVDFLEAAEPAMRSSVANLRLFMAAEHDSQERFVSNLEDAQRILGPIVAAALDRLEMPGSEGSQPPHSNTGVTPNLESPHKGRDDAENANDHNDLGGNRRRASHGGRDGGSD